MARKTLILLLVALASATMAFAGGAAEQEPEEPEQTGMSQPRAVGEYGEAPMLAEMVATGELPPVEERLPKNPMVIETGMLIPADQLKLDIGSYGGDFIDALNNGGSYAEPIMLRSNLGAELYPNIIEDWDVSEDFRVYTMRLREGLKWSDGEPVTTEDVRFCYEDVILNEEIYPTVPSVFKTGGTPSGAPLRLAIVDPYTFQYTFDAPHPEFLLAATWTNRNYSWFMKPKHYLSQFHKDYADSEKLAALLDEENLSQEEWFKLFNLHDIQSSGATAESVIGTPSLAPWVRKESPEERMVMERNPYYFAVDTAGNQLPYMDRIVSLNLPWNAEAQESANMMVMTGQIDYIWSFSGLAKLPLMKENEEQGDYTTYLWADNASYQTYLNFTYEDPVWREVVGDVRFRQALNYGIDRDEMIQDIIFGQGLHPERSTPMDYDPQKANQLLDEMGMTARDSEGYRRGPDGETFEIFVEIPTVELFSDAIQLMIGYYRDIGLKMTMKEISWELIGQRMASNEHQATMRWSREAVWPSRHEHDYVPQQTWAPLWQQWYTTDGEKGEEPPAWIKEVYDLHERIMSAVPGSTEDKRLYDDLYDWYAEYVPWVIWVSRGPAIMHFMSNRVGNVPASGVFHHATWWVRKVQYLKGPLE